MNLRSATEWFKKATVSTGLGGALGGTLGLITGCVGGGLTQSIQNAILASGAGGAVFGASVGLLEATPLSTSKMLSKLCCAPQCGLFAGFLYCGTQIASTMIGLNMLNLLSEISYGAATGYSVVGGTASGAILLLSICIIIHCKKSSGRSPYENQLFGHSQAMVVANSPATELPGGEMQQQTIQNSHTQNQTADNTQEMMIDVSSLSTESPDAEGQKHTITLHM